MSHVRVYRCVSYGCRAVRTDKEYTDVIPGRCVASHLLNGTQDRSSLE